MTELRRPRPGEELLISRDSSVQFAGQPPFTFRVISVSRDPTYHGWTWLTGYQLDDRGRAVAKREIYVRLVGLRPACRPER